MTNANRSNLRSAAKARRDAAYAKLPPAIIVRPLRYIADNTLGAAIIDPKSGATLGHEPSPEYRSARIDADRGRGADVRAAARRIPAVY